MESETAGAPDATAADDQFGQVPASVVMSECLRIQGAAPPRSALAKIFGRSPLTPDASSWYLGALGEREVGAVLATLGESWTAVHSVPVGTRGSDVDHVLIGEGGVFTINTKFHAGAKVWVGSRRMLVNGQKVDHLRNARFEAARVARLLSDRAGMTVEVTPLVVIVGAKEVVYKERPDDVVVLTSARLARWLRRLPSTIDAETVERLGALIRARETWTEDSTPLADHRAAFDALHREVGSARVVRFSWSAALFVAAVAAGWPYLAGGGYAELLTLLF